MTQSLELVDEQEVLMKMHPALDVVDDTLYVAVQVQDKNQGIVDAVLTSDGNAYLPNEWSAETTNRGLISHATVDLVRCGPRWNTKSLKAFLNGELEAPTWKATYDAIYRALDERLEVVDRRYLTVLTLHIMMTYVYVLFDVLPILHLQGPPESGKSRAGDAVQYLAFNGIKQGSATPAVIFRYAHMGCYTQVLAEGDHLSKLDSDDAFVRQLQSSCSKPEAWVDVTEQGSTKKHTPTVFYGYSPRVILSTRMFKSHPLKTRSIRLDFVKTPDADRDKLSRSMSDEAVWAPLRDMLYRLQLLSWREVVAARDDLKRTWRGAGAPTGRTFDKWLPLVTIAELVDEDVLAEVQAYAAEDLQDQQQDAAGEFTALLFKFASWYVRRRYGTSLEVTRKQLHDEFWNTGKWSSSGQNDLPLWVRETDSTVSTDQLHQWFRGPGVLLKELQKLKLVPKVAKRRGDNNYYQLDREHIIATAQEYVGEYLFGEPKAEAPETDTKRTMEHDPDDDDLSLDEFSADVDVSLPTKPQVRMATPKQVAFMVLELEWDEEEARNYPYEDACEYLAPFNLD